MDYEKTFALAIEKHGALPQVGMLYEEMGELMAVINQWMRGRVEIERVAEELADVGLMLQQLPYVIESLTKGETDADGFNDMADLFFEQKMERLGKRLGIKEADA